MPTLRLNIDEISAALRDHLERRLLGVRVGHVTLSAKNVADCCEPARWVFTADVDVHGVAFKVEPRRE